MPFRVDSPMTSRLVGLHADEGIEKASLENRRLEPGVREVIAEFVGAVKRGVESDDPFSQHEKRAPDRSGIELADHENAARFEHPERLLEDRFDRREVVDGIDSNETVDRIVPKRERSDVALKDVQIVIACFLQHSTTSIVDERIAIEGVGRPPGAAAEIHDGRKLSLGIPQSVVKRSAIRSRSYQIVQGGDPVEERYVVHDLIKLPQPIN